MLAGSSPVSLVVLSLVLACANASVRQYPDQHGPIIQGAVFERSAMRPVSGAVVSVVGEGASTTTDAFGRFVLALSSKHECTGSERAFASPLSPPDGLKNGLE